jgi:hypothetical protein
MSIFVVYVPTLSVGRSQNTEGRIIVNDEVEMIWKEAIVA